MDRNFFETNMIMIEKSNLDEQTPFVPFLPKPVSNLNFSTTLNDHYAMVSNPQNYRLENDCLKFDAHSSKTKHILEHKRIRNMFSPKQIEILEKVFEQTHYPDSTIRENLSIRLNLSSIRIQTWYQNRRAKFRKLDSKKNFSDDFSKKNSTLNKEKGSSRDSSSQVIKRPIYETNITESEKIDFYPNNSMLNNNNHFPLNIFDLRYNDYTNQFQHIENCIYQQINSFLNNKMA